jgi:hypothetical protein
VKGMASKAAYRECASGARASLRSAWEGEVTRDTVRNVMTPVGKCYAGKW